MSNVATPVIKTRTGELAWKYCKVRLPLQVCQSAAGFYIGTYGEDGPCSRESVEYYRKREQAETALKDDTFTQRDEP